MSSTQPVALNEMYPAPFEGLDPFTSEDVVSDALFHCAGEVPDESDLWAARRRISQPAC